MIKKFLLVFIIVLSLCSCNEIPELDKNYILSGIGFDKSGDEFTLTAEAVGVREDGEKAVFTVKGESPEKAYKKLKRSLPLGIIADHLGVVVLSENLDSSDCLSVFEFLRKETSINLSVFLIKAKNPEKLLNLKPSVYETVSYDIMGILKQNKKLYNRFYEIDEALKKKESFILPLFENKNNRAVLGEKTKYKNFKRVDKNYAI